MSEILRVVVGVGLVSAALAGCSKGDESGRAAPAAAPAPAASTAQPTAPQVAVGENPTAGITGVLEPYETCRALLAGDELAGVADCAAAIEAAAGKGADEVFAAARPHMSAAAAAAKQLAVDSGAIEPARMAFGELSRAVVGLLEAAPGLAKQYYVFECPMAKGFNRWVQKKAEISNPYMGQSMPSCGTKVAGP